MNGLFELLAIIFIVAIASWSLFGSTKRSAASLKTGGGNASTTVDSGLSVRIKNSIGILIFTGLAPLITWIVLTYLWDFNVCDVHFERCHNNGLPHSLALPYFGWLITFQIVIAIGMALHGLLELLDNHSIIGTQTNNWLHALVALTQVWMFLWMLTRAFGWTTP